MIKRDQIALLIVEKLTSEKELLKKLFLESKNQIGYFYIDNLLPKEITKKIYDSFPKLSETELKKNIREYKYVAYQMDKYNTLLEEIIYAFQDSEVVRAISAICQIKNIIPDDNLYAGGVSLMKKDNYLNPHLDNSHDKDKQLWRVLNLLFYVTPDWKLENGGNLELWNNGLKNTPIEIESKFNRLVVMSTHQKSWHSVNKVLTDNVRCCVSNYYFSKTPLLEEDNFHITLFRGRSTQKVKDIFLRIDNGLRKSVRKFFKKGIRENPHQYKK
jgi:Rps23 Pro-64 3,4-dihydroxylase Tpa1-like proline 4-hydroxylase